MAATFIWCEDNGAQTGSPLHGTARHGFTQTTNVNGTLAWSAESPADVNWKAIDDTKEYGSDGLGTGRTAGSTGVGSVGTPYGSAPITAGNNGFTKFQYGKFCGSFTQISSAIWGHWKSGGETALGTGLTLKGLVTSTYATPSATTNAALTVDMSAVVGTFASGQTGVQNVNFSTVGPEGASPTATLSAVGYTQYLATQLQTTGSAVAGDTSSVTLTLQYNEN